MYIPKFIYLARFGGEICEDQIQKIRKNDQNPTFLRQSRVEMRLKSRDPQKAHLDIPNVNFLAQFGGELCEEQAQKM